MSIEKNLVLIYISAITLPLSWVCWLNLVFQLCPISILLLFPVSSFAAVLLPVSHPQSLFSQLLALLSPSLHVCSNSGGEPRQTAYLSLPISFLIEHSLWCSGSRILPLSHWPFCIFQEVILWLVQVTAELREVCVVFPKSSPLLSHSPSVVTS